MEVIILYVQGATLACTWRDRTKKSVMITAPQTRILSRYIWNTKHKS